MTEELKAPVPGEDRYRTVVRFESRDAARKLARAGLDQVETQFDDEGGVRLVFLLTRSQISELEKQDLRVEVGENVSEIGRERQKEVAEGDRFDGGQTPPRGRGVAERRDP